MVDVAAPGVCGAGAGLDNGALCLNVAHCARGRVPRGCHGCSKPFAIVGMLDFINDPTALAKVSSEQLKSLFDTAIRHQAVPILLYVAISETLPTENLLGDTDGGALLAVTFPSLFLLMCTLLMTSSRSKVQSGRPAHVYPRRAIKVKPVSLSN